MKSVTLPSYAKVNLHLRVLGKRPDGAHELLTLFERIDLSDELTVSGIPGHRIEVECDSPEVPTDASNLAFKAAEGFRQALGLEEGLRISLKKQIPVAGGLGGGSSNAAATLLALQRLFGSPLPHEKLLRAAAALGSDVPFFLYEKGWALGRGRGEIIEPLPLGASFFHLLVAPGFLIPTKDVYRAYSLPAGQAGLTPSGSDVTLLLEALRKGDVLEVRALLFNALEPAAESLYPALSDVKATITAKTGLERPTVSGSGSSVFALCESRAQAMEAAGLLRRERSDWRVWVVQTKG